MSVVVLGMEMPECCQDCEGHLVGEWNEYDEMCDTCIFVLSEHPWEPKHKEIDGIDTSKSTPDWCPIRPLPEKHGRLIDADAFIGTIRPIVEEDDYAGCTFRTVKELMTEHIDEAPTIVEAEGGDAE